MAAKFSRLPSEMINVIRKNGHILVISDLRLTYKQNTDGISRMTIIVSKKVAKLATARNRIKRVVRESLNNVEYLNHPLDVIIDIKSDISHKKVRELVPMINELFRKIY